MAAINLNRTQFEQHIHSDTPVLVDFWAPWCSYCVKIAPAYDRVADQCGDDLIVAKVNVDEELRLAQAERIEVIPTLVLYRSGEALGSIVAPTSQVMIEDFIRETLV